MFYVGILRGYLVPLAEFGGKGERQENISGCVPHGRPLKEGWVSKISRALIGIAGVHFVVSELSRRGMVALPTTRNTAAYDIVVATPDGTRHANIQVKTSLKRRTFFLMPPSARVKAGLLDYYVLVHWLPRDHRFEGFMLSGRQARREVQRGENFQRERIREGTRKVLVPSIYIRAKVKVRADRWREKWLTWTL